MVLVTELPNAFWGVTVNEGKRYTQKLTGAIHVSMAALEPGSNKSDDGPVSVMIHHEKADFMLCSLSSAHVFQQTLDLNFNDGEEVTFYLKGKGVVHLTGYILTGDQYDSDSDEDFLPGSNAFDLSDDSSSSDDDEVSGGSKKRKKPMVVKNLKKPKVEIVDEDNEDDDDDSDMDDDDDDDEEEEEEEDSRKKKFDKKKVQVTRALPAKKKTTFVGNQRPTESITVSNPQSTSAETGEKKKKKKKKKNKNKGSENSAQADGAGSTGEKGPSKPSSKVVEGVAIQDLKVGHGPEAKAGTTVHVYYTGRLANGKLFDSRNSGKPFKLRLGKKEVIKGWDIGLQGMKVGGKRKLVIPPNMGYGSQNLGTIPPNSTLQFEVELKAVN